MKTGFFVKNAARGNRGNLRGAGAWEDVALPFDVPADGASDIEYRVEYQADPGEAYAVERAREAVMTTPVRERLLAAWRLVEGGRNAARIGRIVAAEDRVILETELGGERFLEELEDDPLPRIC